MPAAPKPPEQRRRRNLEQPKRAASTALPATNRRKAPPAPAWLKRGLHAAYREVWTASVANLWPPSARELVARLVDERDRLRRLGDDATPALRSAVLQLERELLLGPKSARQSGVTVRDEDAPAAAEGDEQPARRRRRSTVTPQRRERILRAVQ